MSKSYLAVRPTTLCALWGHIDLDLGSRIFWFIKHQPLSKTVMLHVHSSVCGRLSHGTCEHVRLYATPHPGLPVYLQKSSPWVRIAEENLASENARVL